MLPDDWTGDRVTANGIDLGYLQTGEGPSIVLAHGMFDDSRRFVPLGSALAETHEIVAYDARGHGRSDAPETGYDIESRVADCLGLIDALSLDDPILLGHSMGAATAAWTAATRPDGIRGLVLLDPSRFRTEPSISVDEAMDMARDRLEEAKSRPLDERIERLREAGVTDRAHARRLADAVTDVSPHVAALAQEHDLVREAFDEIDVPTLVLRRDLDVEGRVADLTAADRLADGRLVHVPDAGHYVDRDAPEAVLADIRTFLRRLDSR